MLSRNASYALNPEVVLRTFPEWGRAYAFTPEDPEIYDLNATAWLIVELADGRPFTSIEAAYVAELTPHIGADAARRQFHAGFDQLLVRGILSVSD